MFVRPAAVVVAIVASLAVVAPPASGAARNLRGHWPLNEVKSKVAKDTSGHHHNGTNFHIVGNGSGYTFNGRNSRVIVPDARSLDPKAKPFSFRVRLSMTEPPSQGGSYDVLRKGLVTTPGGDYKLEVKNVQGNAVARCVVRSIRTDGTRVLASVEGTSNLADGVLHNVTCIKTSTSLSVRVDSMPVQTKTFPDGLGSVSNTSNLALGAKAESTASTGFDWFDGVIANAWVASP